VKILIKISMNQTKQIEGRNVVLELLKAGFEFTSLWLDQGGMKSLKVKEIVKLAERAGVGYKIVARQVLDKMSHDGQHKGVVAEVVAREHPGSVAELLAETREKAGGRLVLMLKEVLFEHNLGAITRTAEAAGVDAIIIPTHDGARFTPTVTRVSMGATEFVPVIATGLLAALTDLKNAGFSVVGAEADGEMTYDAFDWTGDTCLIMGGEDAGLSKPLRDKCDAVVQIPSKGVLNSLNVSVATGVLLFEALRQRR
jgi:23S rRNA (guanosine2251-2'-O)-methyltransferase